MTIKSFPALKKSQCQFVSFYAVLSFLLKVYKFRTYFSFKDLYLHSLECVLSVIWSISAPFAFNPNLNAKAGGGRESDFHVELAFD